MTDLVARCRSPVHRAALRLTGVALGAKVTASLLRDLAQSDPVALAHIGNVEHTHCLWGVTRGVDPALDAALPEDLWLYWHEMTAANADRVAQGRAQLAWIGGLLAAEELRAVVLKGGADLLDPPGGLPETRFVSDLDLLLSEPQALRAQDLLTAQGGRCTPFDPIIAQEMHHLPVIDFADQVFPVEIHHRTGVRAIGKVLPADQVLARAVPSDLPGIWLPAPDHRVAHLVLHMADERLDRHRLYLRAALDMARWQARPEAVKGAQALLRTAGNNATSDTDSALAFDVLTGFAAAVQGQKEAQSSGAAVLWLAHAMRRFGAPKARALADLWVHLRTVLFRALTDADRRRHYLRLLTRPAALRARFQEIRRRWFRSR